MQWLLARLACEEERRIFRGGGHGTFYFFPRLVVSVEGMYTRYCCTSTLLYEEAPSDDCCVCVRGSPCEVVVGIYGTHQK